MLNQANYRVGTYSNSNKWYLYLYLDQNYDNLRITVIYFRLDFSCLYFFRFLIFYSIDFDFIYFRSIKHGSQGTEIVFSVLQNRRRFCKTKRQKTRSYKILTIILVYIVFFHFFPTC
jgi:hypothetical protein